MTAWRVRRDRLHLGVQVSALVGGLGLAVAGNGHAVGWVVLALAAVALALILRAASRYYAHLTDWRTS